MTGNIVQLLLSLVYQRPFLNQNPYHEVKLIITVHIGINTTSCPAPLTVLKVDGRTFPYSLTVLLCEKVRG